MGNYFYLYDYYFNNIFNLHFIYNLLILIIAVISAYVGLRLYFYELNSHFKSSFIYYGRIEKFSLNQFFKQYPYLNVDDCQYSISDINKYIKNSANIVFINTSDSISNKIYGKTKIALNALLQTKECMLFIPRHVTLNDINKIRIEHQFKKETPEKSIVFIKDLNLADENNVDAIILLVNKLKSVFKIVMLVITYEGDYEELQMAFISYNFNPIYVTSRNAGQRNNLKSKIRTEYNIKHFYLTLQQQRILNLVRIFNEYNIRIDRKTILNLINKVEKKHFFHKIKKNILFYHNIIILFLFRFITFHHSYIHIRIKTNFPLLIDYPTLLNEIHDYFANKRNSGALFYLGINFFKSNDNINAIKNFKKAIEIYPKYASAYFNYGRVLLKLFQNNPLLDLIENTKLLNLAIENINIAINLKSSEFKYRLSLFYAYTNFITMYNQCGDYELKKKYFDLTIIELNRIKSKDSWIYAYYCATYGYILYQIGYYKRASKFFMKAHQVNSSSVSILNNMARNLFELAKESNRSELINTCITYYEKALNINPYYVPAWQNLGALYFNTIITNCKISETKKDHFSKSKICYLRALKYSNKQKFTSYIGLAQLFLLEKKYHCALKSINIVIKRDKYYTRAFEIRGYIYIELNNFSLATFDFIYASEHTMHKKNEAKNFNYLINVLKDRIQKSVDQDYYVREFKIIKDLLPHMFTKQFETQERYEKVKNIEDRVKSGDLSEEMKDTLIAILLDYPKFDYTYKVTGLFYELRAQKCSSNNEKLDILFKSYIYFYNAHLINKYSLSYYKHLIIIRIEFMFILIDGGNLQRANISLFKIENKFSRFFDVYTSQLIKTPYPQIYLEYGIFYYKLFSVNFQNKENEWKKQALVNFNNSSLVLEQIYLSNQISREKYIKLKTKIRSYILSIS